jgi:hypothetical protein
MSLVYYETTDVPAPELQNAELFRLSWSSTGSGKNLPLPESILIRM